jgi:hypothetical protein
MISDPLASQSPKSSDLQTGVIALETTAKPPE